jgi:hypothetical protein
MDLEGLIRQVESGGGDHLERLRRASARSKEVAALADALLDHFIQEGREAGLTWTQIGEALEISKQAAQQRSSRVVRALGSAKAVAKAVRGAAGSTPTFARFTDKARHAVTEAQNLAEQRNHPRIGTEHLLAGLFVAGGVGAQALTDLGLDPQVATSALGEPEAPEALAGAKPTFTPEAKKALERSLREALKLGHNYIGTEHIALGLLMLEHGTAHDLVTGAGVEVTALRARIEAILEERRRPPTTGASGDQA